MKLFLASRFRNQNTIDKLSEYVGGFEGKKIAYIPTADNGESGWEDWKHRQVGSWTEVNKLGAEIKLVILEEYRNESVLKDLEGKDIIWFTGGVPGYLMYWIKRCKIDVHIKDLLNSGSLFFGSSAGAMVAGKSLQVASFGFGEDNEIGAENIEPMKLVDFDIFPHFQDEYFENIKKRYTGRKIYLLKDGEEIIVEDDKVTVIGEERIITND